MKDDKIPTADAGDTPNTWGSETIMCGGYVTGNNILLEPQTPVNKAFDIKEISKFQMLSSYIHNTEYLHFQRYCATLLSKYRGRCAYYG